MKYFSFILIFFYLIPSNIFTGFPGTTLIMTPSGYRPINELSRGDLVYGFDGVQKYICEIINNKVTTEFCYMINIVNIFEPIICSEKQKFYLPYEKKWKAAKNLKRGDILLNSNNEHLRIENIYETNEPQKIFDISVSRYHNFFVSKNNILVHNFIPIVFGTSLVFGMGTIEWVGFFGGISFLGSLIGFNLLKNKQNNKVDVNLELGTCTGSPSPDDDDNENKFKVKIFKNNEKHIFRNSKGHLSNTPQNRKLLIELASDSKSYVGTDKYGNQWYAKTLPDGKQLWASVRGNLVRNGGLNTVPKEFNNETGLCKL